MRYVAADGYHVNLPLVPRRNGVLEKARDARDGKAWSKMPEEESKSKTFELAENLLVAFVDAYPDMPANEARHVARNLAQVLTGVIDIGEKLDGEGEMTHMDMANVFVYWCVTSTYLEDIHEGRRDSELADPSSPRLTDEEMRKLTGQFAARAADMMICFEVLTGYPEMRKAFVRGTIALGASDWERNRGKMRS